MAVGTGGALIKVGTGTLTLTGTNTYSGGTTFNGGTLAVNNDANLGTGPLSFNGGTLEALAFGGGITSSKAITLNGWGGTFSADTGTTSTLSGVIGGTGAFTKAGAGMLILTGANTYSGATTISAGTLQAGSTTAFSPNSAFTVNSVLDLNGNSNTVGSLAGSGTVTNNGQTPATLTAGGGNSSITFSGALSDWSSSLGFTKTGTGTTILSGLNTYTGGTVVNAGTLTVSGAQALGLGDVVVNGGILNADPQPINVKGNYTQNAGRTLQLQVAGANRGQYDTLNVGGNAKLNGVLQPISLGYVPQSGDSLGLATAKGSVSGQFTHFIDPFTARPGLNTIDLVYGRNFVQLQFLDLTSPISPVIPTTPATPEVTPPNVVATMGDD